MEFKILGPLEVVDGDRQIPLGGPKRRALLAMLILRRGSVVAVDELIESLWGEDPPKTAGHSVQVYVSEIRKALGDAAPVLRRDPGYTLAIVDDTLDAQRFEALRVRGRAALDENDPRGASALLGQSLGIWRGAALADFTYEDFARGEIERLEELRLSAIEDRVGADLALGRHAELVAELRALVDEHPTRERLRADLMLALYRSGRQPEAVEVFHAGRALLGEGYGLDPGVQLAELASKILASDPSLDLMVNAPSRPEPSSELPPQAGEPTRRIVTTLAVDATIRRTDGSPRDPEAVDVVASKVAEEVRAALVARGATVLAEEAPDIVAVFGHPRLHEDDAVRAVAAADELVTNPPAVDGFDVELAAGIHTGEIVSTDGEIARDVARDARRLAAVAGRSGIVIDGATLVLVRDAVESSPLDGEMHKVTHVAHGVRGVARRLDSELVGRDAELAQLRRAFEQVREDRACHLITVSGEAGIGKTRLTDEFIRMLGGDTRVLIGRCLSFGEGITYWPVAEAIRAASAVADDADVDEAREALRSLMPAAADRDRIVDGLTDILGVGNPSLAEGEAFWSVRRFLEELAVTATTVLLIEDVHWAEPTLLDLLDGLMDWMRDSPLLVVCTTRPDIYERRQGWGGRPGATTMSLRPLARADVDRLIENLVNHPTLDDEAKQRIAAAAEGNPLFVEQLLAMLIDEGLLRRDGSVWSLVGDLGDVVLPTSVHALLAARLDRLPPDERAVLGIASVIGGTFGPAEVADLLQDDVAHIDTAFRELVRKDLVRPERTPDGEVFRFRHVLILQTAYEMLAKGRRAELHEAVAERLGPAAVYDELAGDHLVRAARALEDIGQGADRIAALRAAAAARLAAGAGRAFARGDMPAAASLYGTATELIPDEDPRRLSMLPELGNALVEIGRLDDASRVFDEAINRATERGDLDIVGDALLFRFEAEAWSGRTDDALRSVEHAGQLISEAESTGHEIAQQRALSILGIWADTSAEQQEYTQRAFGLAVRAGDKKGLDENIQLLSGLLVIGPARVTDALDVVADFHRRTDGDRVMAAAIGVNAEGQLLSMSGRIQEGRAVYERARETFRELGLSLWLGASGTIGPSTAELIGGDPAIAEAMLREGVEILERISPDGLWLIEDLRLLVQAHVAQGHADEAAATVERLRAMGALDRAWNRFWPGELLRAQGRYAEAVDVLRETLDSIDEGWTLHRSQIAFSLASALRGDGREQEAIEAAHLALGIVEAKGDIASTTKIRAFLDASS